MEINPEEGAIKYSKLIEQNAEDKEPSLILSQKTIDKLKPEKLVLEGIENNNYPSNTKIEEFEVNLNLKFKGKQRKFGFKTLLGLSLAFLSIVAGLIAGLLFMHMKVQNLEMDLESRDQFAEDFFHVQNMSQSQISNFIKQNRYQINEYDIAVKHLKNAIDDKGLLSDAIKSRDIPLVKFFLEFGADVNARDQNGDSPIYHAVCLGYNKIAELLIQKGANVNEGHHYHMNQSLLLSATVKSDLKMAEILLQNGADPNAADVLGQTPLLVGAQHAGTSPKVVELLLQHGANVDARNKYGNTPLHYAAQHGRIEVAKLLLEYGAKKNLKNQYGKTPSEEPRYRNTSEDDYEQVIALLENN